jgi:hypothetical protein
MYRCAVVQMRGNHIQLGRIRDGRQGKQLSVSQELIRARPRVVESVSSHVNGRMSIFVLKPLEDLSVLLHHESLDLLTKCVPISLGVCTSINIEVSNSKNTLYLGGFIYSLIPP